MEKAVTTADCVIALVTGSDGGEGTAYFERYYCLQELRWAAEKDPPVYIQPVISWADKTRIGEFIAQAPDDLKILGKVDFIDLNTSDVEYWDAGVNKVIKKAELALLAKGSRRYSSMLSTRRGHGSLSSWRHSISKVLQSRVKLDRSFRRPTANAQSSMSMSASSAC